MLSSDWHVTLRLTVLKYSRSSGKDRCLRLRGQKWSTRTPFDPAFGDPYIYRQPKVISFVRDPRLYHLAKFHADRLHRRRDVCPRTKNRVTSNLIWSTRIITRITRNSVNCETVEKHWTFLRLRRRSSFRACCAARRAFSSCSWLSRHLCHSIPFVILCLCGLLRVFTSRLLRHATTRSSRRRHDINICRCSLDTCGSSRRRRRRTCWARKMRRAAGTRWSTIDATRCGSPSAERQQQKHKGTMSTFWQNWDFDTWWVIARAFSRS